MSYQPRWRAARETEILAIANRVRQAHPDAWAEMTRDDPSRRYINLVAAECQRSISDRGVLRAHEVGCNGKRGNPNDLSRDVLALPNETGCTDRSWRFRGLELIDIVVASDSAEAHVGWTDLTQATIDGETVGYWVAPVGAPPPPTRTILGASLFWGFRGFRDYRNDLDRNLHDLAEAGIWSVRCFVHLGGDHLGPYGEDPWEFAGLPWNTPGLAIIVAEAIDYFFNQFGIRTQITATGGHRLLDTPEKQSLLVRIIEDAVQGREQKVTLIDAVNEYIVNGFTSSEVRHIGRELVSALPGVPIGLSSPNSVMGGSASREEVHAEVERLHRDHQASVFVYHQTRPVPIWGAGSDFGAWAPRKRVNNEPRGTGASAGGDVSDPRIIAGDYANSKRAGDILYNLHTVVGIFGGRCHPHWNHQNRFGTRFVNQPNWRDIMMALRAVRDGGIVEPPLPPLPSRRSSLLPGQRLVVNQSLVAPSGRHSLHYQPDGNLVLYEGGRAIWASRTDGNAPGSAEMQYDGNFVVYDPTGKPLWASGTWGQPSAMVQLQDDGNLVIYRNGEALWASRTR